MQYAKVAEYQRRGVVHFHALIRLDGPKTADGFAPAPAGVDRRAAGRPGRAGRRRAVRFDRARRRTTATRHGVLAFGAQVDARPVRTARRTDDPDRALTPEQVAGYLAKYATKSATDTTERPTTRTCAGCAPPSPRSRTGIDADAPPSDGTR